jgi:hypothetical protein
MKGIRRWIVAIASVSLLATPTAAQTYSTCNPLTQGGCPADSALARSVNIDFTQGASSSFTSTGNPTYDSNGVTFTVAKAGDSPLLLSKWYIMFGKVSVVAKAAPGQGIVSSFTLLSDDLDEIDWEWLGGDSSQVQSNFFGKGQTTSYNRGAFHADSGSQSGFNTYTIVWTATQIVWSINGVTVRVQTAASTLANSYPYPQTPMQVKFGIWAGGDPSNPQGTIAWAGGLTDYTKGPYSMQIKSVSVQDYSTGTQYTYSGTTGNWQDITAVGGSVNSGGGSAVGSSAPSVTSVSSGQPIPFDGKSSAVATTPTVYPWVPQSTFSTSTISLGSYPGLPSGWTVSSSGKVVPPSAAPVRKSLLATPLTTSC